MSCLPLPAASVLLFIPAAFAQVVTDSAEVRVDGRVEHVRKINGRWWSQDNRQMTPPGKGGFFWTIQSKRIPEVVFYHHRPVKLAYAEQLHLFMSEDQVRALLGDPNETYEDIGTWTYYASDGTALHLRFFREDGLGEASYHRSDYGVSGKPVASIEQELAGRSIFAILAQRAGERSAAKYHPRAPLTRASSTVGIEQAPPAPRQTRPIDPALVQAVVTGMARADVIARLGEPARAMKISGAEREPETLTYDLESGRRAEIRLEEGKVVRIREL